LKSLRNAFTGRKRVNIFQGRGAVSPRLEKKGKEVTTSPEVKGGRVIHSKSSSLNGKNLSTEGNGPLSSRNRNLFGEGKFSWRTSFVEEGGGISERTP